MLKQKLEARVAEQTAELEASREQLNVLVREMQHRSKNLLAVVQSLATNTLSRAANVEEAAHFFVAQLPGQEHMHENAPLLEGSTGIWCIGSLLHAIPVMRAAPYFSRNSKGDAAGKVLALGPGVEKGVAGSLSEFIARIHSGEVNV
jgi:hypothetical protein